ncbi:MAG: right-handed parallel beta-helix repeat-containing protein [Dehalococcoidales bacterium]
MLKRKIINSLLALVLLFSLGAVAALPVIADGGGGGEPAGNVLNVSNWTAPTSVTGTATPTGRQATIKVGSTYHMWYSADEATLYYTSSTNPATDFAASASCSFTGGDPANVGSVTVFKEGATFYMITYGANEKKFAIYTSPDGIAWTFKRVVLAGEGSFDKIDGPFLMKDGNVYRLYFQARETSSVKYSIYSASYNGSSLSDEGIFESPIKILQCGELGKWGQTLMHPAVVKDGDMYYMWFSSHDGKSSQQQIGFASSEDGTTWVNSPGNPIILQVTPHYGFAEPSVIKDGDIWRIWYTSKDASSVKYMEAAGPFEFSSIQAAINAAEDGDTIQVAAGTYNLTEPIVVNKKVTLTGNTTAPETVVLNAPTDGDDREVFQVLSDDVTIQGFTIQGSKDIQKGGSWNSNPGIAVGGDKLMLVNKPTGATEYTFNYWGFAVKNINILNNIITNNSYGIFLFHSQNVVIEGNKIYNNTRDANTWSGKGIAIYTSKDMADPSKVSSGTVLPHTNNITINDNEIYGNKLYGIELNHSEAYHGGTGGPFDVNVKITNNTIHDNSGPLDALGGALDYSRGISANGNETNVTVTGNVIYGHTASAGARFSPTNAGIRLNNSHGWTIQDNEIYGNMRGIYAYGTSTNITINAGLLGPNLIYDNAQGICVSDGTVGTVNGNNIYDNDVNTWTSDGINPAGVINGGSNELDATNNWWGDASGPKATSNPDGAGNAVSDNVNFDPWLGAIPVDDPFSGDLDLTGALSYSVNGDGEVLETVAATTDDEKFSITIPAGTTAKDEDGNPLAGFTVNTTEPEEFVGNPPANANSIGTIYEWGPAGATFDPFIIFEFKYEYQLGMDEDNLVVMYYDGSEWVALENCEVDKINKIVTAYVTHFTPFSLFLSGTVTTGTTTTTTGTTTTGTTTATTSTVTSTATSTSTTTSTSTQTASGGTTTYTTTIVQTLIVPQTVVQTVTEPTTVTQPGKTVTQTETKISEITTTKQQTLPASISTTTATQTVVQTDEVINWPMVAIIGMISLLIGALVVVIFTRRV